MAKMTWEIMLAKYERLLKAKEKELYANYRESYRQLDRDFREIYGNLDEIEGQLSLDDWSRQLLNYKTGATMQSLYLNNDKLLRATFNTIFETTRDNSLRSLGGTDRLIGINKAIDRNTIINKSRAGVDWAGRLAHHNANTRYDLINITAGGIEAGDSYTTISKKVAEKFTMDYGKTRIVVQTEGHRIHETTKYETMAEVNEELGLEKTWHCVGDERVRHTHQYLDGKTVKFDEEFVSSSGATALRPGEFGVAEEDINCRCYVSYDYKK
nr:MAG TPA: minor capsid protein [Caudoviricetes sp.]